MPDTDPRHEKLQALLQDRKAKKGRASRDLHICLDAELSAELAEAEGELDLVQERVDNATKEQAGDTRVGGRVPIDPNLKRALTAAEEKADAARDAAAEATVTIKLVALPADEFDELLKKHPPKDGDEDGKKFGADKDSFLDALLPACAGKVTDRAGTIIDLDPAEIFRTLSAGERSLARAMALEANQRMASVPFSIAKSSSAQDSGGRSKRR